MTTFTNRTDAGTQLAEKLKNSLQDNTVILAIPKGGVPVAFVVSEKYNLPLDISLSKKIGYPGNKEFAIGSVSLFGRIIDYSYPIENEYLERETIKVRNSLKIKHKLYMGTSEPLDIFGKNVIIIDDGIATGHTIMSTIDVIKTHYPKKITVATPVCAPPAYERIKKEVDEVIALLVPENFLGVGQFYDSYEQVSDETVIELLHKTRVKEKVSQKVIVG